MVFLIYLLILISVFWFASRCNAVAIINRIGNAIPHSWVATEEIVSMLKIRKISDQYWILVIPMSIKDILGLWDIHKSEESKFFFFVRCDINCILMQLEQAGIIQKKVVDTIHFLEVIKESIRLLDELKNLLGGKSQEEFLNHPLFSGEDIKRLKQINDCKEGNGLSVSIYHWRKIPSGKRSRKKIFVTRVVAPDVLSI